MGVSKSTDAGVTWSRDTLTTAYSVTYALAVDRSNSNVVYAGGYTGLYKSTDAGNTWFQSSIGLTGQVYDIAVASTKANIVYAGSSAGVFKSTNAGASWTNTGCTGVNAVLINPSNENEIYAATSSGVFKSTTGGGGWTAMNAGLQSLNTTSLGIYPAQYLYTGTDGAGLYRWSFLLGTQEQEPSQGRTVLAAQPNPCRGRTQITYQLVRTVKVNLGVYDAQGRLVRQLACGEQPQGVHSVAWDGLDRRGDRVANGVYFCRLKADGLKQMQKLVIVE